MVRERFLAGFVLICLLLSLVTADALFNKPVLWVITLAIMCGVGACEFSNMCSSARPELAPTKALVVSSTILLAALPYVCYKVTREDCSGDWDVIAIVAIVAVSFLWYYRKGELPGALVGMALTTFCAVYVGLLCSFIMRIRVFTDIKTGGVLLLVLATKIGDVGAFFVGKKFGRHKMAPVISPNKTVEGGVANFVVTVVVGMIVAQLTGVFTPLEALLCSVMLGAVGQLGDLSESAVKRALGAKDSGNMVPGFGGVLDVIDSFFFAAPALYIFARIVEG